METRAFKLVGHSALRMVGVHQRFAEGAQSEIWQMWAALPPEQFQQLLAVPHGDPHFSGPIGVTVTPCETLPGSGADQTGFEYWIATSLADDAEAPPGMDTLDIPAGRWAVFDVIGAMPTNLQATFAMVYGKPDWFAANGLRRDPARPDLEWYSEADTNADDYHSQVWIPVQP